jgi:hypothetical protein
VKYGQCLKIGPFDVLVLFLKCVQFLKPCVQFLMDSILNLVKKEGDMLLLCASLILRKRTHSCSMRVTYLRKGRRAIRGRVFILLNCTKKDYQQNILHWMLSAPHACARLDTCSV